MINFQPGPHIMVDLETLGTSNDALILSLGACRFHPDSTEIVDSFYVKIDPASAQAYGLKIDVATVMWWMEQDAMARDALTDTDGQVDLVTALEGFAMWVGPDSLPLWGNGATFDNVLLRSAYKAIGMDCPWAFWDDRCYRTVKNLAPEIKLERAGVHHNALDDAISQAKHLQAIARCWAGVK